MGGSNLARELLSESADVVALETKQPEVARVNSATCMACVESIEVEAVIGGVLQRIRVSGLLPNALGAWLKEQDPNAQVRTEFPSKSFGGKRETKKAQCISLTLKKSEKGLFGDFLCQLQDGECVSVGITKRFDVDSLGVVLSQERMAQVKGLAEKGGALPLMLNETERFTVCYWTGDDGAHFVDSVSK